MGGRVWTDMDTWGGWNHGGQTDTEEGRTHMEGGGQMYTHGAVMTRMEFTEM